MFNFFLVFTFKLIIENHAEIRKISPNADDDPKSFMFIRFGYHNTIKHFLTWWWSLFLIVGFGLFLGDDYDLRRYLDFPSLRCLRLKINNFVVFIQCLGDFRIRNFLFFLRFFVLNVEEMFRCLF